MRVYAEPDTEESKLGFSLFCVRKWAEIWGGDNTGAKNKYNYSEFLSQNALRQNDEIFLRLMKTL